MRSLPSPRGPVSELLLTRLQGEPGAAVPDVQVSPSDDQLVDEDSQLALYRCYELSGAASNPVLASG